MVNLVVELCGHQPILKIHHQRIETELKGKFPLTFQHQPPSSTGTFSRRVLDWTSRNTKHLNNWGVEQGEQPTTPLNPWRSNLFRWEPVVWQGHVYMWLLEKFRELMHGTSWWSAANFVGLGIWCCWLGACNRYDGYQRRPNMAGRADMPKKTMLRPGEVVESFWCNHLVFPWPCVAKGKFWITTKFTWAVLCDEDFVRYWLLHITSSLDGHVF